MKRLITLLMAFPVTVGASQDYAAWARTNKDGSWTAAAETAVKAGHLAKTLPADIGEFCPPYATLDPEQRVIFWVGLLSIMARPESDFDPRSTYREKFPDSQGRRVISRGLLQISIESANQKRYSCGIEKPEDLYDPATNLQCGVKILDAWVSADKVIASWRSDPIRGGARYWSTLRQSADHLPEITGFTKKLLVCSS